MTIPIADCVEDCNNQRTLEQRVLGGERTDSTLRYHRMKYGSDQIVIQAATKSATSCCY